MLISCAQNPTPSLLDLLRHLLLLVFVWNKSLPQRILPVSGEPSSRKY